MNFIKIAAILSLFVTTSFVALANDLHQIAKEGSWGDMNVRLDQETDILVKLDEVDEYGRSVWDCARLNPDPRMLRLLRDFREEQDRAADEQNTAAFDRGFLMLGIEEEDDMPEEQPTQFDFEEEIRGRELVNHFWGIERLDAGRQENIPRNPQRNDHQTIVRRAIFTFGTSQF